jgi:hypothetical protein
MSSNEPPAPKENDINELKSKLNGFIEQSSITQFEGDDVVQLVQEGESIEWIVNQLKANSPNIDSDAITTLLTNIKSLIAPGEEPAAAEAAEESTAETESPDASLPDLDQLDLSQLAGGLPADMELPPGVDVKQLKNLMNSAQGKIVTDFLLFCQERGVKLGEAILNDPRTQDLQNEWKSTPRDAFDGKTPAEMMEGSPGFMTEKIETYRRVEPRVGRNDPCPCGSGKKFKKCCGRP